MEEEGGEDGVRNGREMLRTDGGVAPMFSCLGDYGHSCQSLFMLVCVHMCVFDFVYVCNVCVCVCPMCSPVPLYSLRLGNVTLDPCFYCYNIFLRTFRCHGSAQMPDQSSHKALQGI